MSVLDFLLGHLAPFDCLGCGQEGALLCHTCLDGLKEPPGLCYRCHRASPDGLTCSGCRESSPLYRERTSAIYQGAAKDLIWGLKSNGTQAAAAVMARRMKSLLPTAGKYLVVPIPTATSRVRQRGYNQAALIARQLARQSHLPLIKCLVRRGQAHQVGAGREQRLSQLSGAFRVVKPRQIKGAGILLIDDVLTTGATLESAAAALSQAGAARVEALTFARPLRRIEKAR